MSLGKDFAFPGDKEPRGYPGPGHALWNPVPTGESEATYRTLVESIKDYAIILLDIRGTIATWNAGARRITGYESSEIIGRHFSCFYPPEDILYGKPQLELEVATAMGQAKDEGWRLRKDGSHFWADVTVTPIRNRYGELHGYAQITRDITERKEADEALKRQAVQLEIANKELEAFSYSVSHDLRAPLRSIDGFSQALLEECGDKLDATGAGYLQRVRASTARMNNLIEALLKLAQISRSHIKRAQVDLSAAARSVIEELEHAAPERRVQCEIQPGLTAMADLQLLRIVLANLLSNAWKFTRKTAQARIEFGFAPQTEDGGAYFVRDNGAGFNPAHAGHLFAPFQRLHDANDYEGTGVGLATVQRIILRHGGNIWAESNPGQGATFFFTLPSSPL